jgi:hypothetical protein
MKKMCENFLNELPDWILGTIMKELNLSNTIRSLLLDELRDRRDTALTYWRQKFDRCPPKRV